MEYNTPNFRNVEINARVLNLMHIYMMMLYSPVKQLYILFFFFSYLTLPHSEWTELI